MEVKSKHLALSDRAAGKIANHVASIARFRCFLSESGSAPLYVLVYGIDEAFSILPEIAAGEYVFIASRKLHKARLF